MGFTDDEIQRMDDRLVDAVVAWGDADAVAARVAAQRDAGADHVAVSVVTDTDNQTLRRVARAGHAPLTRLAPLGPEPAPTGPEVTLRRLGGRTPSREPEAAGRPSRCRQGR